MVQQKAQQIDPRVLQQQKNQHFMQFSYPQVAKMNQESGSTSFAQGKNITFSSPVINGAYAQKILIKHKIIANWTAGTTGTVSMNAAYPYNLVNTVNVGFGNRQITVKPYVFGKVQPVLEGYGRTLTDKTTGQEVSAISNLLHKVPTSLVAGDNEITFTTEIPLNSLHNSSINGLLPVFSSNTRVNVTLNLPSAVNGNDPLDNVFNVGGDGVLKVSGDVDCSIVFRGHESLSSATQPIDADLTGLPTVQVIQLPSVTNLAPKVYNHQSFKNPYKFARIVHILIDGQSSSQFADPANVIGMRYDKAENSNQNWFAFDETTGGEGVSDYYYATRERFGQDFDPGVFILDATSGHLTGSLSNVSSRMGSAYLNLDGSKGGYSAARFGFKFNTIGTVAASRIESYGIILNDEGIKAL